jgi:PAS domain S-box-containing protein
VLPRREQFKDLRENTYVFPFIVYQLNGFYIENMITQEALAFSIHDLPTPTLIYSQSDGRLLQLNRAARELLGYDSSDQATVNQWRGHVGIVTKQNGSETDLGVISITTKNGEQRVVRIHEKEINCDGEPCFVNWITDLTGYVQAEKLSETLIFGKMGSAELDLNTMALTVSKELFQMLDVSETTSKCVVLDEFLRTYISPAFLELVIEKISSGMQSPREEKKVVEVEFEMITAQGRKIWIEGKGIFKGDNGLGILHDITERKQNEQKIIKEREHLNDIINSLPGIFYLFDQTGKFLKWNKNFETISGYSANEIEMMSPLDFFRPEEKDLIMQRIMKVFEHGMADVEANFLTKDDITIPYYFNGFAATFEGQQCLIGMGLDLTDLRQAEYESRSRLKLIEIMLNGITDGFFAVDRDLNLRLLNPVFASHMRVNAADAIGKNLLEVLPALKGSETIEKLRFSLDAGIPAVIEHRGVVNQGIFNISVYPNEDGLFAFYRDVTERKHSEQALRESELRLRTILETEPECVKILNERGELLEMNKAGLEMIEASDLEQVKHQQVVNLVNEPYRAAFIQLTRDVFDGKTGMLEFQMTGLKGNSRWLETHAVPMKNSDGKIVSLLGVTRDITERKEAEEKLRESEERYRKLFELNPAPTWTYDSHSLRFLHVNHAAVEHYGYTAEEFKQMTIADIRPEEDRNRLLNEFATVKTNDSEDGFQRQWRHVKKDGSIIDVEVLATSLESTPKSPRLATITDVTEKLKAQNKLMDLVKEKEILIREIHHRVKNNLQLISSIFYMRLNRMPPGEMKNFLSEMRQRIKSIAFLHERLLQSGSINQLEMSEYLQELIADVRMTIDTKEITIDFDVTIEKFWMDTDSAIYCGLIMNELITNSIKYGFKGNSHGTISVSLTKEQGNVVFKVADNGVGIDLPINIENNSSFGMQLIDTFGKQLRANVMIDNTQGTAFKFIF